MLNASNLAPESLAWSQLGKATLALLIGLLLGFLLISRGCNVQAPAGVSKERYVVLVSTLYAEGENLKTIRGYVDALGSKDPQGFLLQTADRYAKSGDRIKQRQADTVRLLATALRQQEQGIEVPPVVQPAAALPSEAQPAVAAAAPTSPVAAAKGVVQVPQGDSARVRTEPKTAAPTIIQLSSGAKVDIIDVIRGQEVTAGENRWYKVKSNDSVGYVYYPLIAPAN